VEGRGDIVLTVGFDFDNTLFKQEEGHEIGEPIQPMIDLLKKLADEGHIIIIYSGRKTEEIEAKVKEFDLPVHAINDKKLKEFDWYQTPSGKKYFDILVDDRTANPDEGADGIYDQIQMLKDTKEIAEMLI
jgi:hypothetical protein